MTDANAALDRAAEKERLIRKKLALDTRIATLRAAVVEAKRRHKATGARSDWAWLTRTEAEIKTLGAESQGIQLDLGKLKADRRVVATEGDGFRECFRIVAQRRLTPEFYAEIEQEAKEMWNREIEEAQ